MKHRFKPDKSRQHERNKGKTALSKTRNDFIDYWSISILRPRLDDYTNMYMFSVDQRLPVEQLTLELERQYMTPVYASHQPLMRTLYYKRNTYYVKLSKPHQWRDIEKHTHEAVVNVIK